MEMFSDFLDYLESQNVLDRKMEFLPSKKEIQKRKQQNFKLTKPELAVILSYSKRYVYSRIIDSKLIQEKFCTKYLLSYFPKLMQEDFRDEIKPVNYNLLSSYLAIINLEPDDLEVDPNTTQTY
jgi:glutamate dehydrogenase